jgi:hypothetical protein
MEPRMRPLTPAMAVFAAFGMLSIASTGELTNEAARGGA